MIYIDLIADVFGHSPTLFEESASHKSPDITCCWFLLLEAREGVWDQDQGQEACCLEGVVSLSECQLSKACMAKVL